MAYQTFRVELTRDETRDGAAGRHRDYRLYRPHARDQRGHDRAVEPGVSRGMEQSAAIHRRFRYTGGGACRDHGGLSGGRPHPLLRIYRRQRIPGRGGAAAAIRGEMAAGRLVPSSPLLLRRPRLRTHPPAIMLDREDVAVEGRGPLLTLHGHLEITQRVTDIALYLAPIKLRIAVDHIGRTSIAELLVNAVFDEFVVERVQLARVERIAQLTNQIAGPDQARFRVGSGVVFVVRHREARELDGPGDALLVYPRNGPETLADKNLPPFYVIGHQEGVGGSARGRHCNAGGVGHEVLGRVAGADAAHIPDVVMQRGQDGMAPLAG